MMRLPRQPSSLLALALSCLSACSGEIGGRGSPDQDGTGVAAGDTRPPGGGAPRPKPPGSTTGAPPANVDPTPRPAEPVPPPVLDPGSTYVAPSFTCKPSDAGGIPRRLWRLSALQYQNSIATFFTRRIQDQTDRRRDPPKGFVVPFTTGATADRFSTADAVTLTDFEFRRAMESTSYLATLFVQQNKKNGGNCYTNSATPVTKGCVRQTLKDRGPLLFRRPLTDAELDHYDKLAKDAVAAVGEEDAAALALQAFFMAPQFLFRSELGDGASGTGAVALSQHELAAALALTLSDFPPDEPLWAAAEAGQLATAEQIRAQVARLLAAPDTTGPLRLFLREYFRYDRALDVFKDPKDYRGHDPVLLTKETDRFVQEVLMSNARKDFLKTLLTSDVAYVTMTNNNQNATYTYGVTGLPKNDGTLHRVSIPGQRAGILTQPSFLVGFSESTHNQPVQRGRFIAESLLCQSVPELPVGQVPPLGDVGPDATMRERLVVHAKDPACWACHKMMDHLGFAFEIYDHVGRFRTMEGPKPVDASGKLDDAGADGPFANALELTRRLAVSPLVQQCFVRHGFRALLGRNEVDGDGCALVAAHDAYQKSGGDLVEMISALFVSKSSLARVSQ